MKLKIALASLLLAFTVSSASVAGQIQHSKNPLAIPLQAHGAKDMWESFFNQCWSYDFVDKKELDTSLKVWQKRNANRWQVYWLLLEQAADKNEKFKVSYLKFKEKSLANTQQKTKFEHEKYDDTGKKKLCGNLVNMLNDPRSDLPEDASKKTQKQG
ncbi:hypothetical protein [Psychromonas hadalis]|uniref:hypothetical protein n=1 Tax=Psychromonas hadalis TaxID=211669 RepID=UPI0003B7B4E7|nr:hypothetical protein [Psychromonas hadalis]